MGQIIPTPVRLLAALLMAAVLITAAGCGKSYVPTSGDRSPSSGRASSGTGQAGPAPKGTFKPYTVGGKRYYPLSSSDGYEQEGIASWYGRDFHGKKTANGEIYDMYAMTCAHKVLPMNTYVRITNLDNGKVETLRVNDRGPFVGTRIVDLSYAGAKALDVVGPGTAHVRLEAVGVAGSPEPHVAQAIANADYYVQVGSFTVADNAERLLATLRSAGYGGSRVERVQLSGRDYWRVQAGVFHGMDQAHRAEAKLESTYPSAFVIAD